MLSRTARAAAFAAALVPSFLPATSAAESALSLNHELTGGMSHADCMIRAEDVLRGAGLTLLAPTSEAAWGESQDRQIIASIYCLKTRDVAMFAVSGPTTRLTSPLLAKLVAGWRGERR